MVPLPGRGRKSGRMSFACIRKLVLYCRVVFPPLHTVFGAVLVPFFCAGLKGKNVIYLMLLVEMMVGMISLDSGL